MQIDGEPASDFPPFSLLWPQLRLNIQSSSEGETGKNGADE